MARKSVKKGPNKGIRYEDKINKILKEKGFQSITTKSGGASDAPDGFFWYNKEKYPLEIKGIGADFAQIELRWEKEKGFFYSEESKNEHFGKFLLEGEKSFLNIINETWIGEPRKFVSNKKSEIDRNYDLDHFNDIKEGIDVSYIEHFYNSKSPPIHYVQIESKGFFYLGKDILKLGVPRINGEPYLRARVKTRSTTKNTWGFLVAIKMPGIKASTHNIEESETHLFPFSSGTHIKQDFSPIDEYIKKKYKIYLLKDEIFRI